jgi:hypothetical protein
MEFQNPHSANAERVSTAKFAAKNLVSAQTVHKHHSLTGSFYGVRPTKLANGRLAWPDVMVER